MRRIAVVTLAVAAAACSGRTAVDGEGSESDTETGSESATETTGSSDPDLSTDLPPTPCENGIELLPDCSADTQGFTCYGIPSPNVGIEVCEELISGPGQLGFSNGIAACGCDSIGSLRFSDLDGDGADELLASCGSPEAVFVWRGRLDGALGCADVFPVDAPNDLWLVDHDEDGLDDLITIAGYVHGLYVSLLRATEPGVFEVGQPLDPGITLDGYLTSTLELDIDGDGDGELLATQMDGFEYGPVLTWSAEAGELSVSADVFGDLGAHRLLRSDIDGDGWPDLVATAEQSWWVRGSSSGLAMPEPFDGGADHFQIGLGDIDGDQLVDLVLGGHPPLYRLGAGDGTFGAAMMPGESAPDYAGGEVEIVEDLDGDGRAELVLNALDGWSVWRSGPMGPIFDSHRTLHATMVYVTGDGNGDGRGELATASWLSGATNSQLTRWRASP